MHYIRCIGQSSRRHILTATARSYSTAAAAATNQAKPPQTSDGASTQPPFGLTPGPVKPSSETQIVRSSVPAGTKLSNINYFKNKADPVALDDSEYPSWLWTVLESGKAAKADSAEDVGDLYSKSKKARALAKKRASRLAAMEAMNPEKKVPIEEQTVDLPFATVGDPAYGPVAISPIKRTVAAIGGVGHNLPGERAKAGLKGRSKPTTVEIGGEAEVQVTPEQAEQARKEVKKAMRKKGRAKIKEDNFLRQM